MPRPNECVLLPANPSSCKGFNQANDILQDDDDDSADDDDFADETTYLLLEKRRLPRKSGFRWKEAEKWKAWKIPLRWYSVRVKWEITRA